MTVTGGETETHLQPCSGLRGHQYLHPFALHHRCGSRHGCLCGSLSLLLTQRCLQRQILTSLDAHKQHLKARFASSTAEEVGCACNPGLALLRAGVHLQKQAAVSNLADWPAWSSERLPMPCNGLTSSEHAHFASLCGGAMECEGDARHSLPHLDRGITPSVHLLHLCCHLVESD